MFHLNKDFNFFSPYIEVRKTSKANRIHVLLYASLIFAVLAGSIVWNLYNINNLKKDISQKEEYLNSPAVNKHLKEYEELKAQIDELDKYYSTVSRLDNAISRRDLIGTDILDSISSAMPSEIFLQSIESSKASVSLVCTASDKMSIAEFERNLKQVYSFDAVHVLSVNKTDSYFISSIIINIKGVAGSEAD